MNRELARCREEVCDNWVLRGSGRPITPTRSWKWRSTAAIVSASICRSGCSTYTGKWRTASGVSWTAAATAACDCRPERDGACWRRPRSSWRSRPRSRWSPRHGLRSSQQKRIRLPRKSLPSSPWHPARNRRRPPATRTAGKPDADKDEICRRHHRRLRRKAVGGRASPAELRGISRRHRERARRPLPSGHRRKSLWNASSAGREPGPLADRFLRSQNSRPCPRRGRRQKGTSPSALC